MRNHEALFFVQEAFKMLARKISNNIFEKKATKDEGKCFCEDAASVFILIQLPRIVWEGSLAQIRQDCEIGERTDILKKEGNEVFAEGQ